MTTTKQVNALLAAVGKFPKQADFIRALSEASGWNLKSTHIRHWTIRGTPVPAELCPHIEHLTGIPCELLRPDVSWWIVRGTKVVIFPEIETKASQQAGNGAYAGANKIGHLHHGPSMTV